MEVIFFKSAILRGNRHRVSSCVGVKEELGTRHQEVIDHPPLDYGGSRVAIARARSWI
jgi:hypothetical protein